MDRSALLWLLLGAGVLWWLSSRSTSGPGSGSTSTLTYDQLVAQVRQPGTIYDPLPGYEAGG
jgi:hypothetical protein